MILGSHVSYQPPAWLLQASTALRALLPAKKIQLGCFPTPIQHLGGMAEFAERELDLWMKRDDLSSFDLSGNKVRKLEFLLADAVEKKHDSVITIGGIQSNHCRATAVAARQLGLDPYLILRTPKPLREDEEIGLVGNLLFDRMVDSNIFTVSASNYHRIGSLSLCHSLENRLREEGRNPYVIPVGGSNVLGALGYTECVREIAALASSATPLAFDHIVFACGSGGTFAGMALGVLLSGLPAHVHAVAVCDTPQAFLEHLKEVAEAWDVDLSQRGDLESWCHVYDGQGIGYARSSDQELTYLADVAKRTGVLLDPVYSGKAFFHLVHKLLAQDTSLFKKGDRVLFVHTGGTVGLYEKADQLLKTGALQKASPLPLDLPSPKSP
eukprot:gene1186-1296_t